MCVAALILLSIACLMVLKGFPWNQGPALQAVWIRLFYVKSPCSPKQDVNHGNLEQPGSHEAPVRLQTISDGFHCESHPCVVQPRNNIRSCFTVYVFTIKNFQSFSA